MGILSEIRLYHLCGTQVLQQCRPSAQFSLVPPGQLTGNAQRPQGNELLPLMSSHSSPWFFNPPEGWEGLFLFFRGFPLRPPECNKTKILISLDQNDGKRGGDWVGEQGTARLQGLDLRPVLFQILYRGTLQKKKFLETQMDHE